MVTSSRCITQDITATHNFEVTNFSLLDGMGIGKYVSSSTFSVGSYDWKLNFYPDGDDAERKAAYTSVYLCLVRVRGPAAVRCFMSVIKIQTEDADTVEVPPPNLNQDLARMLKDGEGADVKFRVECIEIKDMEPSVFQGLLHFIYTDTLPDDWKADNIVSMQHLLAAADRYGLDRLMGVCEAKLCSWIDVQPVATTLALAEVHQCINVTLLVS
ncbi:hypothetical protein PR202_ga18974 [Eleusine coracana subsp. coracana]|uniref:MATH domain-containing protein n=1 Tax=Eleusine coracana subsp. coracana TaxID=191504 RepID=A0AAV5CT33_ELECO|nr:hypothetical protein PR202_ga18974 [Eleusine coracana subsp. coracana]